MSSSASKSGCSRCAAWRANIRRRSQDCRRSPKNTRRTSPRSTPGGSRLAALGEAAQGGAPRIWPRRGALYRRRARRAPRELESAVEAELAPLKLERARFIVEIASDSTPRVGRGDRPGGVLRANQSGLAAGPADESRLGRRTGAVHAGVESRAGRPRLGADSGVRRDRYGRRRRRRRRDRPASGASGGAGAGACGHPCAAGRGAFDQPFQDRQERRRARRARRDAVFWRSIRRPAARKSRGCSPARRSPKKRAPPPSG